MEETVYFVHTPLYRGRNNLIREPITVALLSDLHNKPFLEVIKSMDVHRPDLIAIPGDLVSGGMPKEGQSKVQRARHVLPFLRACTAIAPTYLSLGNHEWMLTEEDLTLIQDTGVVLLDNKWAKTGNIYIGGLTSGRVTDFWESSQLLTPRQANMRRIGNRMSNLLSENLAPDYAWVRKFQRKAGFKILLSHHPEYWEKYLKNFHIDLVLSGHAHGGQFRYYKNGQWHGFIASGQGFLPEYTEGMFRGPYGNLIISRGLANTGGVIPRLFNPTEIVYIQIN